MTETRIESTQRWRGGPIAAGLDGARDLGHLMRFRSATVRRPWAPRIGLLVVIGLTLVFALVPRGAVLDGDGFTRALADMGRTLAYGLPAFFLLVLGSSMGGGGGRELLSRDQGAIHPISPATEHFGSLVLAPLNLAWLIQVWALLAAVAMYVPAGTLLGADAVVIAWALAATCLAQALGWVVEGVRRQPHGVAIIRVAGVALGLGLAALQVTGRLGGFVEALPTSYVVDSLDSPRWPLTVAVLLLLAVVGIVLGIGTARWALSQPPREELKVESGVHESRRAPAPRFVSPEFALLRRMDRDQVWRSVGMRRGLTVLGVGPGIVVLIGGMAWDQALMLPGLAASGAALLFGVNAWCLDGRGAVWRETLPVPASTVFAARASVVAECLVFVSVLTLLLTAVRSGLPDPGVALALAAFMVVVVLQVVALCMWWSVRRPIAVNLSSPRATPAPPAMMLGYAAKLSLSTTLTGLLFGGLGVIGVWWVTLAVATPFLIWSGVRLMLARRRWLNDSERALIALTVVP